MDFSAKLDELQQQAGEAAAARSRWGGSRRADAIEFAAWTVDHARLAVLDAIDARAYADELAKQAGS